MLVHILPREMIKTLMITNSHNKIRTMLLTLGGIRIIKIRLLVNLVLLLLIVMIRQ